MDTRFQDGPEAREWLKWNGHEAALASNRFPSTEEGRAFVERLYAAGAKRVFIPQNTIIADEEEIVDLGGPYSDTLVVEISDDGISPALEKIYRQEATLDGFDRKKDPLPLAEGRFLLLWWT
jgi:hypothetical protein